ncbi:MAG: ATP-grasp domain-containing protein [Pirellulaceae bacterium]|nr:ATP-grasp domain-containing protein [Pirellulaceae bacterium]
MDANIVILGASVRAAAQSAIRARMSPYGIDLFADQDLRAACPATRIDRYPSEFLRALAAAPHVPWMYTGGLENYPRLLARLAALRSLWGNGPEVCRRVRDPAGLHNVLLRTGFRTPNLRRQSSGLTVPAAASDPRSFVVKPRRGSGGQGVRFARKTDLPQPPPSTVLQRYIAGESGSAVFVAARGQATLLGITRQLVGRDFGLQAEFAYAGTIAPLVVSPEELQTLERLGRVLAREFGLVGLFGVDFVRAHGEVWVIEINPRYTASVEVLERVHGLPLVASHVEACTVGSLPHDGPRPDGGDSPEFAGKLIVYARRTVVIPQESIGADLADIPSAGQTIHPGHPIATVFAAGRSHDEVFERLRARADALHSQLEITEGFST